jgi:flagellar hook protein FlgE
MSFQTGLSGLNASSKNLDVIGNNIANANTTGMKSSRAEFANLVATSLGASGGNQAGIGVEVADVAQQFTQGSINITGNSLDVAINGGGFFQQTMPDGSLAYTRAGDFKLDTNGFIKTNSGGKVMGYTTTTAGVPTSSTLGPLKLPTGAPIAANATTAITAEFNLDARAQVAAGAPAVVGPPAIAAIPATPRSTYGTALNVYDKQGVASPVTLYFEKTATADTWDVFAGLKDVPNVGDNATAIGQISFDSSGKIIGPAATPPATGFGITLAAGTIASLNPNTAGGKLLNAIDVDLSTVTQFGTAYVVSNLTQDGYTSGELTKVNIGQDGAVTATYSNGKTQTAGQLALMDFRNVQGLRPVGGNNWIETADSGQPVQGVPGNGKFGALRSGALEESNVDLTAELVNMMTAQRNYQANAQTIKTQDQVMSTLVNLR